MNMLGICKEYKGGGWGGAPLRRGGGGSRPSGASLLTTTPVKKQNAIKQEAARLSRVDGVVGEPVCSTFVPPHPGVGIAIKGDTWVSGWYPAATELMILKKAYSSQKQLVRF